MPRPILALDGLVSPNIRELKEMLYLWERPFQVDSSRFDDHFWRDATTVDEGIQATVDWYRERGAVAKSARASSWGSRSSFGALCSLCVTDPSRRA